ncbi:MAG: hypothetical protein WCA20_12700 [Candidatus Sulfotelmatobacter sp.]
MVREAVFLLGLTALRTRVQDRVDPVREDVLQVERSPNLRREHYAGSRIAKPQPVQVKQ